MRSRRSHFALSVFFTTTALASSAHAETTTRIETTVTPSCKLYASDFEQRLGEALGETSVRWLGVSIAIERDGAGYRVRLVLRDEPSAPREKVILAPTCEEAVDAAVVVLALATSEIAEVEVSDPSASTSPAIASAPVIDAAPAPLRSSATRPPTDEGPTRVVPSSTSSAASRASLSTGIDVGTLPSPTLVVSGGFARAFSAVEVRAVARYGLPSVNETTETDFSEIVRRDFGAFELRACHGVGADVRVSACLGGELGAVRVMRRVEEGGTDVDEEAVSPRLSGVLAAFVRHQGGTVQPELEVLGSAVAAGRQQSGSWLALRVSAGAAVQF